MLMTPAAGLFAGAGVSAMKMAPKNPMAGLVAVGCAVGSVASLSVLGLSSDDAKKITSSAELQDAAAHIEAAKSSVMNSI